MIATPAQMEANRKNAARSTGPKTAEGKARSRANALKHGLCSTVVVAEETKLLESLMSSEPQDGFQFWLKGQVSILAFQIDRCQRMARVAREQIALRAELCWESDRRLEATMLGEQLARCPEKVAEQLRRTFHGCEWLMSRWAMLAHVADLHGTWTPDQIRLANNLLGTPEEFRDGYKPGLEVDFDGQVIQDGENHAAFARREINRLKVLRDQAIAIDEAHRASALAELNDDVEPNLKRLHRYETSLHHRLKWYLKQIHDHASQAQSPGPDPATDEPATPEPGSVEVPPIVEEGQAPTPSPSPVSVSARVEKKLKKAEERREARLRKLDKRRS